MMTVMKRTPAGFVALLLGSGIFLWGVFDRATGTILPRDEYVRILVRAGESGRDIRSVVAEEGIERQVWGRTARSFRADPIALRGVVAGLERAEPVLAEPVPAEPGE